MKKIAIVCPCFNENYTVIEFINELLPILKQLQAAFDLIIVDDGSTDNTLQLLISPPPTK